MSWFLNIDLNANLRYCIVKILSHNSCSFTHCLYTEEYRVFSGQLRLGGVFTVNLRIAGHEPGVAHGEFT